MEVKCPMGICPTIPERVWKRGFGMSSHGGGGGSRVGHGGGSRVGHGAICEFHGQKLKNWKR